MEIKLPEIHYPKTNKDYALWIFGAIAVIFTVLLIRYIFDKLTSGPFSNVSFLPFGTSNSDNYNSTNKLPKANRVIDYNDNGNYGNKYELIR